jgi:hypothetical protein
LDSSKHRQTNNSSNNKALLQINNYPIPNRKKQKTSTSSDSISDENSTNKNIAWTTVVKPYAVSSSETTVVQPYVLSSSKNSENTENLDYLPVNNKHIVKQSEENENKKNSLSGIFMKEDSGNSVKNQFAKDKTSEDDDTKLKVVKKSMIGSGRLSILHAYVRDDLFKDIKILSTYHLESNGNIMKQCIEKMNVSEKYFDNFIAFADDVRTEVRKTMCSRRGYVKRQIGIQLTGNGLDFDLY